MHELSNDGAREQFNYFLEEQILQQMVISAQVSPALSLLSIDSESEGRHREIHWSSVLDR